MTVIPAHRAVTQGAHRRRELGVGREVDRRGLLFVYDVAGQRLRIEVGAQLEGVIGTKEQALELVKKTLAANERESGKRF